MESLNHDDHLNGEIQKLKGLLSENQKAREASDRSNEAKTQFLANLSHEIRTPISAILGFADLLIEENTGYDRKELGRRIRSNGDQLLRLIDDVLNLSKFEVGNIPIVKEPFSVSETINDVLRPLLSIAEAKDIEIDIQFSLLSPSIIYSDPVRFRQIFTNLVTNALKFTDRGKIQIRVSNEEGFSIEVQDNGIGVSDLARQKIFKLFGQGDSIHQRFGGSGLGLVLSKKLAKALGGDLVLKSSVPGEGSCFQVTLDPGKVSERIVGRSRIEQADDAVAARLENVRILLVDDSQDNQDLIQFYLQREGAIVELASNGFEAVAKVEMAEVPFEVILMDVQMPGMDGLEATQRLRSEGHTLPIIALTAHALREEANRSLTAGCNTHLTKPITRKELIEQIVKQLQKSQPTQSFYSIFQ